MALSAADLAMRATVEDTVIRLFVATDERDWPTVQACFADPLILDMTSMVGGSPTSMTPRQVTDAWAEGFKTLDHVHHQIGNLQTQITGPRARVKCYGVAFHHRAGAAGVKTRVFVGTYEVSLIDAGKLWRIDRLTFKLKFIDGNLELEKSG